MKKSSLSDSIRRLCVAFPEAEQRLSHGMPHFRVRSGKTFAIYAQNHHGDGRIAMWLNTPRGMRDEYLRSEPEHFFVPPYVGPSGWMGVRLDMGLPWRRLAPLVRVAYENVAPGLAGRIGRTPRVPAPASRPTAAQVDPWRSARGKRILDAMRRVCLCLPETAEGTQFGQCVWRVGGTAGNVPGNRVGNRTGGRVFARAQYHSECWQVGFWVGVPAQLMMTDDARFTIPPYIGHQGWIMLDAKRLDDIEIRALALGSYRHFARKRILAKLPDA